MDKSRIKGGAEKARLKRIIKLKAAANDPKQKKLCFANSFSHEVDISNKTEIASAIVVAENANHITNKSTDILNNYIEIKDINESHKYFGSSDDIHNTVETTEIKIDLNDDVKSSNTFERSDTNILDILSPNFAKPKINELKIFFQIHPVQPYHDVQFNPLIAYFRSNGNTKQKREWLSYDAKTNLFYCTFCLAFAKNCNSFSLGCKISTKTIYARIREHELTMDHGNCVEAYLLQANEKDIHKRFTSEKQIEIRRKRAVLERIIETVKLIGKRGLSYRGAKNAEAAYTLNNSSLDHGNFLEMLILISKFDPLLKHHIDDAVMKSEKVRNKCNSGSASVGRPGSLLTMLSKTTADYIIESIGHLIRKTIVDDINKALFFTIQIDSTQDVNVHDQLCVIIRYVTDSVNERLLAFIRCTSGAGQDLCLLVCKLLENSGIDIKKCIGSSTDGASNMRGEYKGFSAWLKKEVPEALHVWCHAHVLNLVMTDVTKICVEGITFFGLLNVIAVFVRESYLRMNKWETTSKYKFISVIGETRWWAKDRCVSKVFGAFNNPAESLYVDIVETLDEIYCTQKFSSDVRFKAKMYLDSILKYETIIMSQIFLQIFTSTTPLSLYLQTKGLNIFNAFKMVKQTLSTLKMQSRDFEIILNATNQFIDWANISLKSRGLDYYVSRSFLNNRIKKKKIMAGESSHTNQITNAQDNFRINTFNVIYDQVTNSLNERFTAHEQLFKSIGIIDPSNFVAITKLSHLEIANNLSYLVSMLKKFDANITVGTLTDELKDFAAKWPKIKDIVNENENDEHKLDEDENEEEDFALDLIEVNETKSIQSISNNCTEKSVCKNCITCCFLLLSKYNLHSMAYSNLFLAYKFVLTLSCTQVCCETSFSKLKYILNRLRNSLCQDKLDTFLLMNIEKDILANVKNDEIIQLITEKSDFLKKNLVG